MEQDSQETRLVCAVDLGGTHLRAAIVDGEGRLHKHLKRDTPKTERAEDVVQAVASAVRDGETERSGVDAVSVVVPGSVQVDSGVVVNAPNIPSLPGYRLGAALQEELGRPVTLENDANAAALGEMWQGAARGYRTVICLTLGTGVGGGIILDGKLWRGIDGTAGEIGHTSVQPFGRVRCKCGNIGCLEVYASGTAIVRMTTEKLSEPLPSSLSDLSADDLTAEVVARAAVAGDELAVSVFRAAGTYLGIAMANLVNIFNPEMIVVGGGMSSAWDLFAKYAQEEVLRRAFPVPAKRCRIVRAECGDNAGLLGAAWLGFQKEL